MSLITDATTTTEAVATTSVVATSTPFVPLSELLSRQTAEQVGDHQHCLVCYSTLTHHHTGIQPCHHNEICGTCHLRLRHLHGNRKCPICKEEHAQIIVDRPGKSFDEYPLWGDELGSNYVYKDSVGMFFESSLYVTEIEPLFGYACRQPNCPYDGTTQNQPVAAEEGGAVAVAATEGGAPEPAKKSTKKPISSLKALLEHLRTTHRLTLCQLCVDHKRDFVALLPRFAPHQLQRHLTKGEPGSGFEGHPVCEFCRPKRFYDVTHLHMHLQKEHYKCHVCEQQGKHNQFFRNYPSLEKHFDKEHFLCHDAQCLQARFMVFAHEIDLQAHERQVHGATTTASGSSKILLEFRVRRPGEDATAPRQQQVPSDQDFNFGLQGEAFVPAAMPNYQGPTLHPLHLQRTAEFRAHAAQIRHLQQEELAALANNQESSFPTLQAATANDNGGAPGMAPLNIGWTSATTVQRLAPRNRPAGAVTDTDFPALPSSGNSKNAATAKLRATAPVPTPQYRQLAAAPPPNGGGWTNSASRPTASVVAAAGRPLAAGASGAPSHYQQQQHYPAMPIHNKVENLTQDNFPALGGGTKKPARFTATASAAAKKPPSVPSWNSAADFPAPASSSKQGVATAAAPKPAPTKQAPPSLNSTEDFPPPPGANHGHNSVKQRVLGNNPKQPSRAAMANVLPTSSLTSLSSVQPVNAKDTLQDLQTSLGPTKYKKLKKLTRDFADDSLDPDAYINHAAALFDQGFGDPEFWKGIPALVASCPNPSSAEQALKYMESLRHSLKTTTTTTTTTKPVAAARPQPTSLWGAAPLNLTPESFPTPSVASTKPAGSSGWGNGGSGVAAVNRPTGTTRYVLPSGKAKNAWGSGAPIPSAVIQPKRPPGAAASVTAAAANEGPQVGTATKFMAQQNKQQKQQQQQQQQKQNATGKKNNKKKEKDELRNLAFQK